MSTAASVASEEHNETILQQMRHSSLFLRDIWQDAINRTKLSTAIDATAGRGSDTISLGQFVGNEGVVHAFDIQEAALDETKSRYEEASQHEAMGTLHLYKKSHEDFSVLGLEDGSVACVVYNLGWYPGRGADRSIITKVSSTIASLKSAEALVAVGGVISVMAYVGHKWGKEEEEACIEWTQSLCRQEWNVFVIKYPNRKAAPSLIVCEKS
ncbi:putative rRNA methylase YtqB [Gracilariopsis chorda]|uniref:Putative rRNA methylase YtqB n=1 Tax=Gracilariopsis chorda TaxID=448386 RepID=A0A2V3ISN5_9FLOR|nr:putative rRNA methylase YtqB [Gracilariopsis chorda]|eukprot:PXF45131.1 putative rRNA methylase YtqB [Gracilariopsis chorda]